ncbi:MAG: GlsB/YeaQ/YmgE family stress response membrane protein, partial [Candidatus Binatia bacterium]
MGIIGTLIIGLIVGLVARAVMPGRQSLGIILTAVLGIGGAFVATYAGQALGLYQSGEPAGFIGAVVGAVVLLAVYGAMN